MKAVVLCVLLLAPLVLARTQVQGDEFAKLKHMFAGLFGGGRMGADVAGATTTPAAGATTAPAAGTTTTTTTTTTPATTTPATTTTTPRSDWAGSPPDFDTRHIPGSNKHLTKPSADGGSWLQATVVNLKTALDQRNKVCKKSRKLHKVYTAAKKKNGRATRNLTKKQNFYNSVPVTSAPKYTKCVAFYQKKFDSKPSEWQLKHPNYLANKREACANKETARRAAVIAKLQATADAAKAEFDKASEKYNAKKSKCKALHQSFRQRLQAAIDETSQRKKTIAGKRDVAFSNYSQQKQKLERLIQAAKKAKWLRNKFSKKHRKLVKKLQQYRQALTKMKRISV